MCCGWVYCRQLLLQCPNLNTIILLIIDEICFPNSYIMVVYLFVEAPVFTTTPTSLELRQGTTVELTCLASGPPIPHYSFFHDGHLLNTTLRYFINGGHLTIRNTVGSDSGQYQCQAENELGSAMSSTWMLQIV